MQFIVLNLFMYYIQVKAQMNILLVYVIFIIQIILNLVLNIHLKIQFNLHFPTTTTVMVIAIIIQHLELGKVTACHLLQIVDQ